MSLLAGCSEKGANGPAALPLDPLEMPRLEESMDDCTYLFATFKSTLERSGNAGIVAVHLLHGEFLSETLMNAVALLFWPDHRPGRSP